MRLTYGNYSHRIAEANIQIRRAPIENRVGQIIAFEETWAIRGRLYNGEETAVGTDGKIISFEDAYSRPGQDLVLRHMDGRPSHQGLRSRDCIGGTQIAELPQFPEGGQGEYVAYRTYTVAIKGVRPLNLLRSMYVEFEESISIRGGAARYGCKEVNIGPGVRQRLRTHSTCFATQSGNCTLFLGNPEPPPPIWPFALVDELPDLQGTGPQAISGGTPAYVNRPLNWTYNFAFPVRLFGAPHYLLG